MAFPSRALIVGCGYLGTRVGSLLSSMGVRVTATTTSSHRTGELAALGLEPALLDLAKPGESRVWDHSYDAVVCAAAPGRQGIPAVVCRDGPLECARRWMEAGPALSARFIYISSTGVYAQSDGSWVDEGSPAEPLEERPEIIRQAEEALLEIARTGGLPAVILRLGGLYGPARSPAEWLRERKMRERVLRGGREAYMNWVRVEDAASAVLLAIEKACPGEIYLVVDDEPVTRVEFYRFAALRAGFPPPDLPSLPADGGKRCSNKKARAKLDFRPVFPTYREGLAGL